jgi:hypothetical protein
MVFVNMHFCVLGNKASLLNDKGIITWSLIPNSYFRDHENHYILIKDHLLLQSTRGEFTIKLVEMTKMDTVQIPLSFPCP